MKNPENFVIKNSEKINIFTKKYQLEITKLEKLVSFLHTQNKQSEIKITNTFFSQKAKTYI